MSSEYYTFVSATVQSWYSDVTLRIVLSPYFREFLEFAGHDRIAAQFSHDSFAVDTESQIRNPTDAERLKFRTFSAAHALASFWRRQYADEIASSTLRIRAFTNYLACVELLIRNSLGCEREIEEACVFVGLARTNDWLCRQNFWAKRPHQIALKKVIDLGSARAPALELLIEAPNLISTGQIEKLKSSINGHVARADLSEFVVGQLLERCGSSNFGKEAAPQARALRLLERHLLRHAQKQSYLSGWADLLLLKTRYGDKRVGLPELRGLVRKNFPLADEALSKYLTATPSLELEFVQLGRVEYPHRISFVFTCREANKKAVILKQSYFANPTDLALAFERERQLYATKQLAFSPKVYALDIVGSSKFLLCERVSGVSLHDRLDLAAPELRQAWRQQIHEILTSLEQRGVVHGDISTRNLLVRRGRLVLIDYESAECVRADFNFEASQDRVRIEIIDGYLQSRLT